MRSDTTARREGRSWKGDAALGDGVKEEGGGSRCVEACKREKRRGCVLERLDSG